MPVDTTVQVIAEIMKKTGGTKNEAINFALANGSLVRNKDGALELGPRMTGAIRDATRTMMARARATNTGVQGPIKRPNMEDMAKISRSAQREAVLPSRRALVPQKPVEMAKEAGPLAKKFGGILKALSGKTATALDLINTDVINEIMKQDPRPGRRKSERYISS